MRLSTVACVILRCFSWVKKCCSSPKDKGEFEQIRLCASVIKSYPISLFSFYLLS